MDDFINECFGEINQRNKELLIRLGNKKDNNVIAAKENLSILSSSNLIEDIAFIYSINNLDNCRRRYIDYILRNMTEHIIEYKFLIKNPSRIEEYFGGNIKDISINNIKKLSNQLGQGRYKDRKTVSEMAIDIEEKKSLYEIYAILSEFCHNAYFENVIDEVDDNSKEYQDTLLSYILKSFLETYRNV